MSSTFSHIFITKCNWMDLNLSILKWYTCIFLCIHIYTCVMYVCMHMLLRDKLGHIKILMFIWAKIDLNQAVSHRVDRRSSEELYKDFHKQKEAVTKKLYWAGKVGWLLQDYFPLGDGRGLWGRWPSLCWSGDSWLTVYDFYSGRAQTVNEVSFWGPGV